MVMRPGVAGHPLHQAGMFSALSFTALSRADAALRALRKDDRGPFAYRDRKQDGAPRGAVVIFAISKERSGARRSQEQGESRMTVLPGARN